MMANVFSGYKNKWVALNQDRKKIVASASNIKALDKKVKKKKIRDVIYSYVLPPDKYYSP